MKPVVVIMLSLNCRVIDESSKALADDGRVIGGMASSGDKMRNVMWCDQLKVQVKRDGVLYGPAINPSESGYSVNKKITFGGRLTCRLWCHCGMHRVQMSLVSG